jgi:hypothetical protein
MTGYIGSAHRPHWPAQAAVGKTPVSSSKIDRVVQSLDGRLCEVSVDFEKSRRLNSECAPLDLAARGVGCCAPVTTSSFAERRAPCLHQALESFATLPCQSTLSVRQSCRTGLTMSPFLGLFRLVGSRHHHRQQQPQTFHDTSPSKLPENPVVAPSARGVWSGRCAASHSLRGGLLPGMIGRSAEKISNDARR